MKYNYKKDTPIKAQILDCIIDLTEKYPKYRIGQIIANAVREQCLDASNCDPYSITDKSLLKGLKKLLGNSKRDK